ncbi:MAG: pseudouridine-5'-phosphate glycosidase [Anaerolineales bacterium]|nr:pseudouridine-5'-phosphate glycosidase [Anaerolineales bacterium]MDW8278214.1 pseudouridine-5'-phosphate glycosidase [Anaerolineales bacterium]
MSDLPSSFSLSLEVLSARRRGLPIVALESTVITHGLPKPYNLTLAQDMEAAVRAEGAAPATIAILGGKVQIGLTPDQLEQLANSSDAIKVSLRDFATALTGNKMGGTTVAGTMFAAEKAGIRVFATGGIGGVHREHSFDVSTDLQALASIPIIVVSAGAKSILDLRATLEYLETMGVPVVGYGTDKFPEFFSPGKTYPVSVRLDTPEAVVAFAKTHWELGMKSAVLVCQPIPAGSALDAQVARQAEETASREAQEKNIRGQELTPFLLKRVNELTGGKSMRANLDLLLNNARLAAQIARVWVSQEYRARLT